MRLDKKFKIFKDEAIKENDIKYSKEVTIKYGDDIYNESIKEYKNLIKEQCEESEALSNSVDEAFINAKRTNNPVSKQAKEAVTLHRKWIMYFWPQYDKNAHLAIANMYVDDERFVAYYDKPEKEMAVFVSNSIINFAESEEQVLINRQNIVTILI